MEKFLPDHTFLKISLMATCLLAIGVIGIPRLKKADTKSHLNELDKLKRGTFTQALLIEWYPLYKRFR